MATVNDICVKALRLIGIRDFTDTDRQDEALAALNALLTSWRLSMHHAMIEESFPLVAGTNSYTIGSGGDVDTARPIRILSAYIRDSSGLDHSVNVNMSKYDYDKIYDKDASERPTKLYYARENPLGIIYFNSNPESVETCYISSLKPYDVYTALTDTFLLPVEYEKAVHYNLAIDLAPEYWQEPSIYVVQQAQILKDEIESENSIVPNAEIPTELRNCS
jgi:hypothetical protein